MSPAKETSMSCDQDFEPDLSCRRWKDDSDPIFNIDNVLKIAEIDVPIENGVAIKMPQGTTDQHRGQMSRRPSMSP